MFLNVKLSENHIFSEPNSRGQESFVHVCTDLSYHSLVLFKIYLGTDLTYHSLVLFKKYLLE